MSLLSPVRQRIRDLLGTRQAVARQAEFRYADGNEVVFEDDTTLILHRQGTGDDLIVSFTGIGRTMAGIEIQTKEFSRSGIVADQLFVIDRNRTWGNGLNWRAVDAAVARHATGNRVVTLGNSMGGFLAILSAKRLGACHAVAFVPQWSIDADILPDETRWMNYRGVIGRPRYRDLTGAFYADCEFHVIFGDDPMDRLHLDRFPADAHNVHLHVLEEGGHEIGKLLKAHDCLYPLIDSCLAGLPTQRHLRLSDLSRRLH